MATGGDILLTLNDLKTNQLKVFNIETDLKLNVLTQQEKADIAGISRQTYSKIIKDKDFKNLVNANINNLNSLKMLTIYDLVLERAMLNNDLGFKYAKLALDTMKKDNSQEKITVNIIENLKPKDDMSNDIKKLRFFDEYDREMVAKGRESKLNHVRSKLGIEEI